jgi:ABC-type dipeptide/oligopeptide/nickel transport system permease component
MNCKFPENLFGWIFEMFEGILEFKYSFWSSPKVLDFIQEAFDWDLEYF